MRVELRGSLRSADEEEDEYEGVYDVFRASVLELLDTSPSIMPVATLILIAVNGIIFAITYGAIRTNPWSVGIAPIQFFANPLDYRVLLSMFCHAGWIHLLSNMLFLFVVGDNVEAVMGRLRYVAFYLLCGFVAIVAQSLYAVAKLYYTGDPSDLMMPMVGASGAIAGVMGAYIYFYPAAKKVQCICFRLVCYCATLPMRYIVLLWILLQFVLPFVEPNIAVFAHLGGLAAGIAFAPLFSKHSNIEKLRELFAKGLYRGPRVSLWELGVGLGTSGRAIVFLSTAALVVVSILALVGAPLVPTNGTYVYSVYKVVKDVVECNTMLRYECWHVSKNIEYQCTALVLIQGSSFKIFSSTCTKGVLATLSNAVQKLFEKLTLSDPGTRIVKLLSTSSSGSDYHYTVSGIMKYTNREHYVELYVVARGDPRPLAYVLPIATTLLLIGIGNALQKQREFEVL